MNKNILKTGLQDFIENNYNTDIVSVLLSKPRFLQISAQELGQQLYGKKKAEEKLPTWFKTPGIYYPNRVQLEQTSSEITAAHKASMLSGNQVADLSGGFGVDTYFFSRKIPRVTYCEIDPELNEIVRQNATALGINNVDFHCADGIEFLKNTATEFDWIYLDPSRRDQDKKKVFQLADCSPDVILHRDLLLRKAGAVMIKTSPLLDLSAGIEQLKEVAEIHVVAVDNEVKELLWILRKDSPNKEVKITAVNFTKSEQQVFEFERNKEKIASCSFSDPLTYLYEPNSAVLKAGAFKAICRAHDVKKLHEHSHLYTSDALISFPGRVFRIEEIKPYNSAVLKTIKGSKVNVSTRNFPERVAAIRKKFKLKDGGDKYLFFTINKDNQRIVIQCTKDISS
ncbi:class I SAM-dependent methyltransferase [Muriicola soli]|uniref:Class I SAM-dependent methyltransferase n=1 Tax=Muriicola soli TaxID=2507538 RepID=A0A411E7Y6_9FLAO|nr:RsmD family RNA methyltransferase [Muriicola soli]QBA63845.1 class I SAM-dependent methyltransferase [Muriicola soli]